MTSPAAGNADTAERRLYDAWQELTGCGLVMDQPPAATSMCAVRGLRGDHSAVDLLVSGVMVWEFIPWPARFPGQVARMVGVRPAGWPRPPSGASSRPPWPRTGPASMTQPVTACPACKTWPLDQDQPDSNQLVLNGRSVS